MIEISTNLLREVFCYAFLRKGGLFVLLSDMITRVRDEIGEPSIPAQLGTQSGTWSDAQIIRYLNDAQALVARPARLEATPLDITLTAGTYAYTLPTDCLEDGLRKVAWTTVDNTMSNVDDVGLDRWRELYNEAQPNQTWAFSGIDTACYCQWAGQIYLFPTPTANDLKITVYYFKYPPDLSASNISGTSLIPARFHTVLVNYAIGKCQAAVEESQLQMIAMQEFQRLSSQLMAERSVENRDRPGRVRVRGYGN